MGYGSALAPVMSSQKGDLIVTDRLIARFGKPAYNSASGSKPTEGQDADWR
jgi:hypothetical protein